MSKPFLNNLAAKHDLSLILISVQVEVSELRGAIMQQIGK